MANAAWVVVGCSDTHHAVELWSNARLPFEPKGELLAMRAELRMALSNLFCPPDEILHAAPLGLGAR